MSGRHTVRAALLGQLLAALIASTAICSTLLAREVSGARGCRERRCRKCSAAAAAVTAAAIDRLPNPAPAAQGVSAPTLQSSLNYLLLGVAFTSLHVRRNGLRWKCRWW